MACYAFPYVFVLVANALDRIPADLEDASAILGGGRWLTFRRVTLPIVLPSLLAGALVAFLQALTQFGTPAILALPAGLPRHHDQDLEPVPVPARPASRRRGGAAAAGAHHAAAARPALALGRRGYTVIGGKSGAPRRITLGVWRWPALLLRARHRRAAGAAALCRAAQDGGRAHGVRAAHLERADAGAISASSSSSSRRRGWRCATPSSSALCRRPPARRSRSSSPSCRRDGSLPGARLLGFLATAPVAIPGIVLGVGLFLAYTRPPLRALRHAVDPAARLPHHRAAGRPISSSRRRSAASIPSSRRRAASSARRGSPRCARSPRRCCARASSPPGASSSSAPSASCRRRSC